MVDCVVNVVFPWNSQQAPCWCCSILVIKDDLPTTDTVYSGHVDSTQFLFTADTVTSVTGSVIK